MAKYEQYTEKQLEILEDLTRKASTYQMQVDRLNKRRKELAPIPLSFEDNKKLRNYEEKLNATKKSIDEVLHAREVYDAGIKACDALLTKLESYKATYGFVGGAHV